MEFYISNPFIKYFLSYFLKSNKFKLFTGSGNEFLIIRTIFVFLLVTTDFGISWWDPVKTVYKVQLFWEGHKNLRNRPHSFDIYLVNVKTMRTIAHIFVAFSEKLNFNVHIVCISWADSFWPFQASLGVQTFFWDNVTCTLYVLY